MAPSRRAAAAGRPATLAYARLQLRIVAFILDVIVLIACGMLFVAAAGAYLVVDSNLNDGTLSDRAPVVAAAVILAYVLAFVPLYHILLWSWWGQTVGKMAVHIRIVPSEGGQISSGQAALRLLLYPASAAPLLAGVVMALFDSERRTLHDRIAGTVVVELP